MRWRTAAIIVAATMMVPTAAHALPEIGAKGNGYSLGDERYLHVYDEGRKAGLPVGRNLLDWSWDNSKPRVSDARIADSRATIERWLNPPAPPEPEPVYEEVPSEPAAEPVATSSGGVGMEGIAACESGGDPTAVSPGGTYRGKYQFDQQTWESVGGTGDPAAAPEAEQDQRAAQLYAERGSAPWPVCGG